jgi:hypothetical protein
VSNKRLHELYDEFEQVERTTDFEGFLVDRIAKLEDNYLAALNSNRVLRPRNAELEAACASCYDAQQRASEEVIRLQAKLDAVEQTLEVIDDTEWVTIDGKAPCNCTDKIRKALTGV